MEPSILKISNISTGFAEIPGKISLNVYLQGCNILCPGCQNPELQPFDGGTGIKWTDFLPILWKHSMCEWVCWLGGEPTCQEKTLKRFNELIKCNTKMQICMYTGTYFNKLSKDLLKYLDLIVDGPWEGKTVSEENTNQKVYLKQKEVWNNISFNELKEKIKC